MYRNPYTTKDPGITKDIFQPSNFMFSRRSDCQSQHVISSLITIDTITKKKKMLIAINSWLFELLVCGYEVKWLISVEL